jgi:hypothetical protein
MEYGVIAGLNFSRALAVSNAVLDALDRFLLISLPADNKTRLDIPQPRQERVADR